MTTRRLTFNRKTRLCAAPGLATGIRRTVCTAKACIFAKIGRVYQSQMDYREILTDEFGRRKKRNPSYSLRAFARDIGMGPGRLSDILNGRYGLSPQAAANVAEKLHLSKERKNYFCELVRSKHARNKSERKLASATLKKFEIDFRKQDSLVDHFAVIADWYHFAILELISLETFQPDSHWIAAKLGLKHNEASEAIERLQRVGLMIVESNKWRTSDEFSFAGDETPSEAIKLFHIQILQKAMAEIYRQPVEKREYGCSVMAVNEKDIPEFKRKIKEMRRDLLAEFHSDEPKDKVYALSLQFFELTKGEEL